MRCRRRDWLARTVARSRPRHVLFTMSNSAVFFVPAALLHPGSLSSLSLLYRRMGGATATPIAGTCGHRVRWISRTPLNPSHEFVSFVSSSRDIRARVLLPFLPSQLPIPERGDGGASGGGILYPVAPVTTRRHVSEAWAVPRNRDGASRRSTVTVLGPLRARLRVASGSFAQATLAAGIASGLPRVPNLPATVLRPASRTPPPAPPSGTASRKRPHERDVQSPALARVVVNYKSITYL